MHRTATVALALSVVGVVLVSTGCGNDCGTGTKAQNGTCVNLSGGGPDVPPGPEDKMCGAGTVLDPATNTCVLGDGGPGPMMDMVPGDGPERCTLMPASCGMGTVFDAASCSCKNPAAPKQVPLMDVKQRLIKKGIHGSFVKDGAGTALYWTNVDSALGPLFSTWKQPIDTATLALSGTPTQVTELGATAYSASASSTACGSSTPASPTSTVAWPTALDICVGSRADVMSPWSNIKSLQNMMPTPPMGGNSSPNGDRRHPDPGRQEQRRCGVPLRRDDGRPIRIYYAGNSNSAEGSSYDICVSDFDDGTATAKTNMFFLLGGLFGNCNRVQPSMMMGTKPVISDLLVNESGPGWTANGKFFTWTSGTAGLTTSIYIGQSSMMNGDVDTLVGTLDTETDLANNVSDAAFESASKSVAWTEIVESGRPDQGRLGERCSLRRPRDGSVSESSTSGQRGPQRSSLPPRFSPPVFRGNPDSQFSGATRSSLVFRGNRGVPSVFGRIPDPGNAAGSFSIYF